MIAINHASFATPYTGTVSPLGISSLTQVSSTILQKIIPKKLKPYVATHIDDLAVAADTVDELISRLDMLLEAFAAAGILVNAEKTTLITTSIDWLGSREPQDSSSRTVFKNIPQCSKSQNTAPNKTP